MNLEIKETGSTRRVVLITFESDELARMENQTCKVFSQQASIPGFRKGKAPLSVIRKRYAKELEGELTRKVTSDAYDATMDHEDLNVHSVVKVEPGDIKIDSSTTVEITIDIFPEFDLPNYEEFELTVNSTEVTDDDITKEIDSLRDQRASYEEVSREIVHGDFVKCSYEGFLDEKPVAEILPDKPIYGKQSNTWEEAGQSKGLGVDDIAQGLVGMKANETKELISLFEEDFEIKPLAGKSVRYSLTAHEVREKKSPELDETFLKTLKVDSIEELKDKIDQDLKSRKERENSNEKRRQVTQKILECPDFPLPQQAVEDESKITFQNHAQRAIQKGAKQKEIEDNREEMWTQAQKQGQARVKLTITLSKIAELEKIEVSNEDLAQAATQEAMMQRIDPSVYIKDLTKDRGKLNRLKQDVLYDKTLEFITSKAKVSVCEIKRDDQQ